MPVVSSQRHLFAKPHLYTTIGMVSKSCSRRDTTGIDSSFGRACSLASNPNKEGTMPVSKQKRTTSQTPLSKSEPSSPPLPEQQEFQQHLRALAQSAVRTVLELVMREELDAFIGAAWGECSPKRKGYRNGTYTRDLVTSTGRLAEINVRRRSRGPVPHAGL